MTGSPPSEVTIDLPIDDDSLPSPGDVVAIRCSVVVTDPDASPPRALAIFVDADGAEVAVEDKQPVFGPDAAGRTAVRGTLVGIDGRTDGFRLRVSLAEPDGLALEDGRREVDVSFDLVRED